jgi:hypothetical protein
MDFIFHFTFGLDFVATSHVWLGLLAEINASFTANAPYGSAVAGLFRLTYIINPR